MATTEEIQTSGPIEDVQISQAEDAEPAAAAPVEAPAAAGRKRPRLDLTTDSRERKRGKSMFGILLGTLNKAKKEDHDRSASEAAKKRADIDRRLQNQLAEENDNVRRAEELKRDRQTAHRKEEDLRLRQTIYQNRRTRLPALAHFLLTTDKIPSDNSDESSSPNPTSVNPLAAPPRTHPPPLYYLPAILLSEQAAFLEKRKAEVKDAVGKEWQDWLTQRSEGQQEVEKLRARVEEEEAKRRVAEKKTEDKDVKDNEDQRKDAAVNHVDSQTEDAKMDEPQDAPAPTGDSDGDKERADKEKDAARDGDVTMTAADGDDAVEY